jgi:FlaA1/EpsC-like NDP-sugar epimerase
MRKVVISLFDRLVGRYGELVLRYRSALVICTQLGLIALANVTAFALRFEGNTPPEYARLFLWGFPIVLAIYGVSLLAFGIQRGLWRYVGLHDLSRILWASVISSAVFYGVVHGLLGWLAYPRSVIILTGVLSGLFLAGIRLVVRWFREWLHVISPTARRVLVVGAGNAGELLIRDMLSDVSAHYRPVGLVDDDPIKRKKKIHGVPIVGTIADIPGLARDLVAHEIIVAIPSASTSLKQRILAASEGCKVPIKTLPSVKQLLANPEALRQVRPMSLEDLLQREPIEMDRQVLYPLLEG